MSEHNIWSIGLSCVALFVSVIALFREQWSAWLFGPKLHLSITASPPHCQRMSGGTWFRVNIENRGRTAAKEVEVWLMSVDKFVQGTQGGPLRHDLIPIPLKLTHLKGEERPSINVAFNRLCDFGILKWHEEQYGYFHLAASPEPIDRLSQLEPARYETRVAITASNAKPAYFNIGFDVPSCYPPVQAEVLRLVNLRVL